MEILLEVLPIIAVLTVLTNIIVEVFKNLIPKLPSNLCAAIFGIVLTIVAFFIYVEVKGYEIVWYYVVAAVVIGFMVAYAAMFGYDKLKQLIEQFGNKKE